MIKWLIISITSTIILLGLGVLAIELFIDTALKELASSEPQQSAIVTENKTDTQQTSTTSIIEPVEPVDPVNPNSSLENPEQANLDSQAANEEESIDSLKKDENVNQETSKVESSNAEESIITEETMIEYEANISPELAEIAQEQITISEKAKLTKMLLNKLTPKEVTLFIKMTSNGVSIEEKKAAKKIILEKLTPEEFDELILIAKRLGLSEGRPYEETIKDYEDEIPTP